MGVCSSNKDDSNLRKQSNTSSNGTTENVVITHKKNNSDSNLKPQEKNNKIDSKKSSPHINHNINNVKIYSIKKFGVKLETEQKIEIPLKFNFHIFKFKCKLNENKKYFLQIIFDNKEFPLIFAEGKNPV